MRQLWIAIIVVLILTVTACGQQMTEDSVLEEARVEESVMEESAMEEATEAELVVDEEIAEMEEMDEMVLTLEELKQYDGQEGRPAYVAVDGLIYDMTNVKAWAGGKHKGNQAGQDLTDVIKNKSPHGLKNLENVPVVGRLATED